LRDVSLNAEPWWRRAVVYQIYPRSFADSDGDGIGDLRGIADRLDHLVDLGVDVVWLSPVYVSPQDDNGYDIADYQAIEPMFGTLADLDDLLAAMHERGLRLVMDLVVNHTSDAHPWFLSSRDRDSPQRDWYFWRQGRPDPADAAAMLPPNNWTSVFLGSAWQYDVPSGEFYLHTFSARQPDLNWENPEVRQAVYAMMRWWLDRGVDGFRMDVINLISKPPGLPDAPGGNQTELVVCGPRMHEFLAEMHREVFDAYPDRALLTVGEMPGVTPADAVLATDPARRELDMVFQFEHVDLDHGPLGKYDPRTLDLRDLKASLAHWQQALAERGWNSLYLNNHDQPRVVSRWGDDGAWWYQSATLLAGVLHLHRGTPFVYQGEEIGMTNHPFAELAHYRDIEALRAYEVATALGVPPATILAAMARMSRDNSRTPVQWDDGPAAGFSSGEPWLPVNPNHVWLSVAAQREDPRSVLAFYRRLIALRKTEDVITTGGFELLEPSHRQLWAFVRESSDERLLVLANASGAEIAVPAGEPFTDAAGGRSLIANYPDDPDPGRLRPWELRALYL
jgi:oligo-1,6-glucosidase